MKIGKFLIVFTLLQCVHWSVAGGQAPQKIRIGYPSISSRQAQFWIAKDEGIFREHGLDVELIFLRGGRQARTLRRLESSAGAGGGEVF